MCNLIAFRLVFEYLISLLELFLQEILLFRSEFSSEGLSGVFSFHRTFILVCNFHLMIVGLILNLRLLFILVLLFKVLGNFQQLDLILSSFFRAHLYVLKEFNRNFQFLNFFVLKI